MTFAAEAILRRLRREMNGAVAGAMEERGIIYPVNYGVSIPAIRDAAAPYFPDHDLAAELFSSGIRELMLSAVFIEDPSRVTREGMYDWGCRFTNPEITENCASQLFYKAADAPAVALEWIGGGGSPKNFFLCYGGLLMAARILRIRKDMSPLEAAAFAVAASEAAAGVVRREDFNTILSHGVVTALVACASYPGADRAPITKLAGEWARSADPIVRHSGSELEIRL